MIPSNTEKEKFDRAMEALRAELENNTRLINVFRKCALKTHPDKQGGDQAVFAVISAVQEAAANLMNTSAPPSKADKVNFARTLAQLPPDIQDKIVTKMETEFPQYNRQGLLNPIVFNVNNTYKHQAHNPTEGRSHAFEVEANSFAGLKEKYQDIKGDFLKSQILSDFKAQVENTSRTYEKLSSLGQ